MTVTKHVPCDQMLVNILEVALNGMDWELENNTQDRDKLSHMFIIDNLQHHIEINYLKTTIFVNKLPQIIDELRNRSRGVIALPMCLPEHVHPDSYSRSFQLSDPDCFKQIRNYVEEQL